jgi:transposase InsO family protein
MQTPSEIIHFQPHVPWQPVAIPVEPPVGRYLSFYNSRRPHSSLDRQTPDAVYFNQPPLPVTA